MIGLVFRWRKGRERGRGNDARTGTVWQWIYFLKADNEEGNAADTFSRKINGIAVVGTEEEGQSWTWPRLFSSRTNRSHYNVAKP